MSSPNDLKKQLREILRLYETGAITSGEQENKIIEFCSRHPDVRDYALTFLWEHPSGAFNDTVRRLEDQFRKEAPEFRDIQAVRARSPLKPGVKLQLGGSYDEAYAKPWWLNAHEFYAATFRDFVFRGDGKMPAAFVELDQEIDLTAGGGQRHKGRFALLKLAYVADWESTETIVVHIVEALPDDLAAFYADDPMEIESRAMYRIAAPLDRAARLES